MYDYIDKPVDRAQLHNLLARWVGVRSQLASPAAVPGPPPSSEEKF